MILFFQTVLLSLISYQNINDYVFYLDDSQLIKRNIYSEIIEVIDFDNPDLIDLNKYQLIVKQNGFFFINDESGLVYKMINNSLSRIDKSLDNRLLADSYIFKHNDTIFRYGGYGFWSQRDFMIYFDEDFKEWEFYPSNTKSYSPEGSYKGVYFKSDSEIYFIGGYTVDKLNKLESKKNTELIKFNFDTNLFEYIGELNFHFDSNSLIVKDNMGFSINNGTQIAYINPIKNLVELYEKSPQQLNLFISEIKKNQNKYFNYKYLIEIFRNSDLNNERIIITKSDFYKNKLSEIKLYKKSLFLKPSVTSLLILLSLVLLVIYIIDKIRFNHIILNSKGIIYKRVLNQLSLKEINFMKDILKDNYITTKSVLKITENKNLSYPHNIKIKDQFIKELNVKLKTIFNSNDSPLEVRSSKTDARIKEHYLNDNFKKIITRLSVKI